MTATRRAWAVRLSDAAEADFEGILLWTADRFGEKQARLYEDVLKSALATLREGPSTTGARPRPEIAKGLYSLHAGGGRNRARHIVLFRVDGEARVEIVRILHDAMDLPRHFIGDD